MGRCLCWLVQVDLLPSDGKSGDGPERPGLLAAGTQKEVGSLKAVLEKWEERLPGATVLPISALEGINTVDVRTGAGIRYTQAYFQNLSPPGRAIQASWLMRTAIFSFRIAIFTLEMFAKSATDSRFATRAISS